MRTLSTSVISHFALNILISIMNYASQENTLKTIYILVESNPLKCCENSQFDFLIF